MKTGRKRGKEKKKETGKKEKESEGESESESETVRGRWVDRSTDAREAPRKLQAARIGTLLLWILSAFVVTTELNSLQRHRLEREAPALRSLSANSYLHKRGLTRR